MLALTELEVGGVCSVGRSSLSGVPSAPPSARAFFVPSLLAHGDLLL